MDKYTGKVKYLNKEHGFGYISLCEDPDMNMVTSISLPVILAVILSVLEIPLPLISEKVTASTKTEKSANMPFPFS